MIIYCIFDKYYIGFGEPRKFHAEFNCAPGINYQVTDVIEPTVCVYVMQISTERACVDYTPTTTTAPGAATGNEECV